MPHIRWREDPAFPGVKIAREELLGYIVTVVWERVDSTDLSGDPIKLNYIGLAFCSPHDRAKSLYNPKKGIEMALERLRGGKNGYYDEKFTVADYVADALYFRAEDTLIPEILRKAIHHGVQQALHAKPPKHIQNCLNKAFAQNRILKEAFTTSA